MVMTIFSRLLMVVIDVSMQCKGRLQWLLIGLDMPSGPAIERPCVLLLCKCLSIHTFDFT